MKIVELVKNFILNKFWYRIPSNVRYVTSEPMNEFKELVQCIHNSEEHSPLRVVQDVHGNYQIFMIYDKKTRFEDTVKDAKLVALYNTKLERIQFSITFVQEIGKLGYELED